MFTWYHIQLNVQRRLGREKCHLLFLDWFQNLDDAFFIGGNTYTLEDLTVFSPSDFPNNLIVILITETPNQFKNEDQTNTILFATNIMLKSHLKSLRSQSNHKIKHCDKFKIKIGFDYGVRCLTLPPLNGERLVIPVIPGAVDVDVGIDASP